jgi:hypothetical protein
MIFSHFLRKARSVPVRPINVAEVGNLSNVRVASEQREIRNDALKPPNQQTYMRLRQQTLNSEPFENNRSSPHGV